MGRRADAQTVDGLVVVDKPAGWTSHDIVAKLRGVYGQRRIGHAGTLDPDATGVLLVGLGRATRLLRFLQESSKAYEGVVAFGVATDTLDAAGTVLERSPMPVSRSEVEAASVRFVGDILQVPPMVSALKVGGRRLHELAREGVEVERAPRPVHIGSLEITDFEPGPFPRAAISVTCSSGTYIRTLAADLGAALGGCAHLASLRRTRVGSFTLAEAHPLETVVAEPLPCTLGLAEMVRDLEPVTVDAATATGVLHGSVFPPAALGVGDHVGPFAVLAAGDLLAVYERRGAGLKPAVVVASGTGAPTPSEAAG
ncbi:MAG: tRNA pseudouridine(55) synthase TruB [Actinomycetes bacterium]